MKKHTRPAEKATFRDYVWALKGIRIPFIFLAAIFAASLLSAYAGMNLSLFTGDMVDARGNIPTNQLVNFVIMYLLIGVAAAGSFLASSYASEKINLGLRTKLWQKIMYTTQRSYDSDCGESLVSRITADCDYSSKLLIILIEILSSGVSLGLYVAKMYRLNVHLANSMLLLIPISVLAGWGYAKVNYIVAQKTQAKLAATTTYLVERTQGIPLIKTASTQELETKKGLENFNEQYTMQIKTGLISIVYVALQHLFDILSLLLPFLIGAKLVNDHVIRAGVVIAFYTMATTVGVLATNFINEVGTIRQANGALTRVINVLKLPDERDAKGLTMDVPDQDLHIEEVSFSYGDKPVLQNVNCSIPKNKVTAIIGSNGSGKEYALQAD